MSSDNTANCGMCGQFYAIKVSIFNFLRIFSTHLIIQTCQFTIFNLRNCFDLGFTIYQFIIRQKYNHSVNQNNQNLQNMQ